MLKNHNTREMLPKLTMQALHRVREILLPLVTHPTVQPLTITALRLLHHSTYARAHNLALHVPYACSWSKPTSLLMRLAVYQATSIQAERLTPQGCLAQLVKMKVIPIYKRLQADGTVGERSVWWCVCIDETFVSILLFPALSGMTPCSFRGAGTNLQPWQQQIVRVHQLLHIYPLKSQCQPDMLSYACLKPYPVYNACSASCHALSIVPLPSQNTSTC